MKSEIVDTRTSNNFFLNLRHSYLNTEAENKIQVRYSAATGKLQNTLSPGKLLPSILLKYLNRPKKFC